MSRWRWPIIPGMIAIISLFGAALLLYPTVAAWFSQYEQSMRIDDLSGEVAKLGTSELARELQAAREYNADIVGGGTEIPANERLPVADNDTQAGDYDSVLAADSLGLMARIKIPRISVDLPVYHGTSDETLEIGVGHLEGTALPVGGDSTHSVLTGHRGLATSELFTNLDQVQVGDTFTIEVFGDVLTYRVSDTRVVAPEDTQSLNVQAGRDLVTLVTCTPVGINSHRILVTGERILPTPSQDVENAGARPEVPRFPWWGVIGLGILVGLGLYVWWFGRPPRHIRRMLRPPLVIVPVASREEDVRDLVPVYLSFEGFRGVHGVRTPPLAWTMIDDPDWRLAGIRSNRREHRVVADGGTDVE